ncbi:hypothetical protein Pmar_PMAR021345 [Perkinsus marinus ATCC 50983]|uniref:Uncharacterized protein n=1 Tax=Perkinsus marinus (strain ATCC 50983 / TXsc) TaxID=423536 RepID=C5KMB7_PERM5|nr:hypothetical protein Pmar_PMAR021345 [Perkinsus marinus ATCC 50983]EER14371.1 hypothetical protein Pmar_PMAR021345 [Perkinsus marinus ATCC 50983]|eukprot:XP_002782576.1 hypothetical protein Pmar_PMAR021345 [Perkinsus marinus ATCC 50983]
MGDCAELASGLRNPVNIYALRALSGLFGTKAKGSEAQASGSLCSARTIF